jgi:hypothetical protein
MAAMRYRWTKSAWKKGVLKEGFRKKERREALQDKWDFIIVLIKAGYCTLP